MRCPERLRARSARDDTASQRATDPRVPRAMCAVEGQRQRRKSESPEQPLPDEVRGLHLQQADPVRDRYRLGVCHIAASLTTATVAFTAAAPVSTAVAITTSAPISTAVAFTTSADVAPSIVPFAAADVAPSIAIPASTAIAVTPPLPLFVEFTGGSASLDPTITASEGSLSKISANKQWGDYAFGDYKLTDGGCVSAAPPAHPPLHADACAFPRPLRTHAYT